MKICGFVCTRAILPVCELLQKRAGSRPHNCAGRIRNLSTSRRRAAPPRKKLEIRAKLNAAAMRKACVAGTRSRPQTLCVRHGPSLSCDLSRSQFLTADVLASFELALRYLLGQRLLRISSLAGASIQLKIHGVHLPLETGIGITSPFLLHPSTSRTF